MNRAISSSQLAYSICSFVLSSSLLFSSVYKFTKNDSWIAVIIGFAASLLVVGVYIALTKRYPGMGLFDINTAVFGQIAGKVVSLFYVFFFISIALLNTRDLGDFVKSSVLTRTPLMIIFIIFTLLCAWAVRKGPVNMTRYGFLLTLVTIVAIISFTLLLTDKVQLKNLLPAFNQPFRNYLVGSHMIMILPFCDTAVFLVFIPFMYKPQEFGRAILNGIIIAAITMLIVVLRDTVVLGKFISIFTMPSYYAARFIDIGDILTRVEIVYAIILVALLFYKVSIFFYATVSGITYLFGMQSYKPFIYIIGALICLYASASFSAVVEHANWKMTAAPVFSTFFVVVLPVLTLLISLIRESLTSKRRLAGAS